MITLEPVGIIHTPYVCSAPFRPDEGANGKFYIDIDAAFGSGLESLDRFSHIIVYFYFDRTKKINLKAHPPKFPGTEVGVFASRSPFRPAKIGMNVVRILQISGHRIYTSPMDILDNTPLIDIKPYIKDLDCFPEANSGWLEEK